MDPRLRHAAVAAVLTLALALVALTAFIPHLAFRYNAQETPLDVLAAGRDWFTGAREGYMLPVHGDELRLFVQSTHLQRGGSDIAGQSIRALVHERGYEAVLAYVQTTTGLDWNTLIVYGPTFWSVFSAFAVFALLRPHPAAPLAALAFALFPTTPRFLGPGLLVPIGFVLPWLVAVVLLEPHIRKDWRAAALLTGLVGWAFFVHLIGGFAALGMVLLLGVRRTLHREPHAWVPLAVVATVAILALVVAHESILEELGRRVPRTTELRIDTSVFFEDFGWPALVLWGVGTLVILSRPPKEEGVWGFAAASVVYLALIAYTVRFDPTLYATYDRWHVPFFFVACVPIAWALWSVVAVLVHAAARAPERLRPAAAPLGAVLVAVLVLVALWPSVTAHADVTYAHPLSSRDVAAAEWFRDHLGPDYPPYGAPRDVGYLAEALTGRVPAYVPDRPRPEEIATAPAEVFLRLSAPGFVELTTDVYVRNTSALAPRFS